MYIWQYDYMNINISQQVPATYARNHFKEVTEKAIKEGICVIMRGSKPVTVVLSMNEFEKMQRAAVQKKMPKKITLEQLRKDSFFDKYVGCLKDDYPKGMTSLELQHNWYKYVD